MVGSRGKLKQTGPQRVKEERHSRTLTVHPPGQRCSSLSRAFAMEGAAYNEWPGIPGAKEHGRQLNQHRDIKLGVEEGGRGRTGGETLGRALCKN